MGSNLTLLDSTEFEKEDEVEDEDDNNNNPSNISFNLSKIKSWDDNFSINLTITISLKIWTIKSLVIFDVEGLNSLSLNDANNTFLTSSL